MCVCVCVYTYIYMDLPVGSDSKGPPAMWETWARSLGSGRSPGGGHGNPLQYFCLENPKDGGAWWATVHGVTESQT